MHFYSPSSISFAFGYKSEIAGKTIAELCKILEDKEPDEKIERIFHDWKTFFQEVSGFKDIKINQDIIELLECYSISTSLNSYKVLFAFHTYYSIIVRWLTIKIISNKVELINEESFDPEFIRNYFFKNGIRNFGITVYFDWYSDNKTDKLKTYFKELNQIASNFTEDAISDEDKKRKDLLKLLYQNLFPPKIRHHLGEYYTPEWVTSLTIKNSGYDFQPNKKVLDPSCGSGTFLLTLIDGILENNRDVDKKIVCKILENIIGLDLNPLAVLSAKANYILAIKKFLPLTSKYDIPVYHFDSVLCSIGDYKTDKKNEFIPIIDKTSNFLLNENIPDYILSTSKFDYIFGNPPWINWKHLPDYYKKAVLPSAVKYNLFKHKGMKARLGFSQDDICVILTYRVIDHFLKNNGILSFVIPQTLFKTIGGGEGFRQFKIGNEGVPIKVLSVLDLSIIKVFQSTASKTAIFTCKKGEITVYPIRYDIYTRRKQTGNILSARESDDSTQFNITSLLAEPVRSEDSNWITANKQMLQLAKRLINSSDYTARAGVCTWASSIYWVTLLEKKQNLIKVKPYNVTAKYKQNFKSALVEEDLIYPLVRGRDITRWHVEPGISIILPHFLKNPAKSIPEQQLKKTFPKTYRYFLKNKKFLEARTGYIKYISGEPFYAAYDIGLYSFSKYKVAWKYLDIDLRAAVIDSSNSNKPYIPDLNVITISTESLEEAHYLAALLNSTIMRFLIQTFGLCTRITPGVLHFLPIKKFDREKQQHIDLSDLSKKCHNFYSDAVLCEYLMKQIDIILQDIFNISEIDLPMIEEYIRGF